MAAYNLLRLSGRATLSRLSSPLWATTSVTPFTPVTSAVTPANVTPGSTALTANSLFNSTQVREFRGKSRFTMPEEWNKPHGMKPSQHWAVERYLAITLIPTIPLCFLYPNAYLEYFLTAGVFLHAHWGFDGIVMDYLHRRILPPALCKAVVLAMGVTAFGCMCYFNYNDVGVIGAVKLLWTL